MEMALFLVESGVIQGHFPSKWISGCWTGAVPLRDSGLSDSTHRLTTGELNSQCYDVKSISWALHCWVFKSAVCYFPAVLSHGTLELSVWSGWVWVFGWFVKVVFMKEPHQSPLVSVVWSEPQFDFSLLVIEHTNMCRYWAKLYLQLVAVAVPLKLLLCIVSTHKGFILTP